jgi:hypothetical protein
VPFLETHRVVAGRAEPEIAVRGTAGCSTFDSLLDHGVGATFQGIRLSLPVLSRY